MAGTESKSIKIHPALEQEMISTHERFGWTLTSSQEIHSQTAHSDEDSVFTYHYTTTTNYIKLIFSRERDFPNREEIVKLEKQYWTCFNTCLSVPSIIPGKIFWIFAAIPCVPSLLLISTGKGDIGSYLPSILMGFVPMILRELIYYLPHRILANKCIGRCGEIEAEIIELIES